MTPLSTRFTHALKGKRCHLCQQNASMSTLPVCTGCFADIPMTGECFVNDTIDPLATSVYAACHYAYPISDMIVAYKYHADLTLLPVISQLFTTLPMPAKSTLLVPMPSSKARLRERGYDHIGLICKKLAAHWQLPVWQGVTRTGDAPSQKGLSREERLHNIAGQFTLNTLPPVGKKLLIIDDVCTTGSTIAALAACLAQSKLQTTAYVLAHKVGG